MDIFAIILPILTIGFFIWFFVRMRRPRKSKKIKDDHTTRQERAVWAWAKILSSTRGAPNTFRMARVEMRLEVHMPGTPAFETKTIWLVEEESLPSVEVGKEIALKADPLDPKYVYPNGTWAKFLE